MSKRKNGEQFECEFSVKRWRRMMDGHQIDEPDDYLETYDLVIVAIPGRDLRCATSRTVFEQVREEQRQIRRRAA